MLILRANLRITFCQSLRGWIAPFELHVKRPKLNSQQVLWALMVKCV